MSEPRNVDDVQYVLSAELDQKPMREVLRDRATKHARQPKALREEAFRVRAGLQALLLSCLCCYPIVKAETESEHQEWCPAHRLWYSMRAAKNKARGLATDTNMKEMTTDAEPVSRDDAAVDAVADEAPEESEASLD